MRRLFRNIFLKNWGLKLFSFLLAVVLWFALIPEEKVFSEKMLTVPLVLQNVPNSMEVVEKPPASVDLNIRASNRLINQITEADVLAVLDLSQAHADLNEYPLNQNMILAPEGVEVKDISPSQVHLKLEMIKELDLTIEPNYIGDLAEGIKILQTEIVPAQVPVRGPESKISEDLKVRTRPIDRSTWTQSIEIEASLIPPSPDLKFASSATTVIIKVLIQKEEEKEESTSPVKK